MSEYIFGSAIPYNPGILFHSNLIGVSDKSKLDIFTAQVSAFDESLIFF